MFKNLYNLNEINQVKEFVSYWDAPIINLNSFTDETSKNVFKNFEYNNIEGALFYFLNRGFDLKNRIKSNAFDITENSDGSKLRSMHIEDVYKNGLFLFAIEKDNKITESFVLWINNAEDKDLKRFNKSIESLTE